MKSTFISYSKDASKKAISISKYLSSLGVETFTFEKNLTIDASNLQETIKNKIKNSNNVILILSAKSKNSTWVSHELGLASAYNKQLYIFKTSHNLALPDYIGKNFKVYNKLSSLDIHYAEGVEDD
ncbi:toll/interleukin-1 receptor domain-containing protein [Shewanella donghaensis]|uniref:toll/interleukin-1 receptor domain-containing protein n=1 Tax=Shewanella donghaensis TaxID=238836 RepID=UPI0011841054|nr:toll/interleukin-1 receptor domain-containing protein [Shewanella donghaensis]